MEAKKLEVKSLEFNLYVVSIDTFYRKNSGKSKGGNKYEKTLLLTGLFAVMVPRGVNMSAATITP